MRCKRPARWSFYHARPDAPETIELQEGVVSASPESSRPGVGAEAAPVTDAPAQLGSGRVAPLDGIEK